MKILITGGKGDIAQAIVRQLMGAEHEIFAVSKKELDVTDNEAVYTYMNILKPDIVINNAGLIIPDAVLGSSYVEWMDQIQVNLIGTFNVCYQALRVGATQIINIGSSAGAKGKAEWSAYCAAKAGVERLTESLHAEGHRATCLRIGRTKTKMRHELFGDEDPTTLLTPEQVAEWVEEVIANPWVYSGTVLDVSINDPRAFAEWREAWQYGG